MAKAGRQPRLQVGAWPPSVNSKHPSALRPFRQGEGKKRRDGRLYLQMLMSLVGTASGGDNTPSAWPEVPALILLPASGFQLEPQSTELLAQEERFSEVLKEYQLKCRVCAPLPPGSSGSVRSDPGGPSHPLASTWRVVQPGSTGVSPYEQSRQSF